MLRAQTVAEGTPSPGEAEASVPASDFGLEVYELTVVAPTFNERANITTLVSRLRESLDGIAWQVIFVDDNSPDGTAEVVKAIAAHDARVQCLRRVGRRGLAGAVVEGVLASAAPFVAVIDADLQHDETLLPKMLKAIKDDRADLVIGSRYVGSNAAEVEGFEPDLVVIGSHLANWLGRRGSAPGRQRPGQRLLHDPPRAGRARRAAS